MMLAGDALPTSETRTSPRSTQLPNPLLLPLASSQHRKFDDPSTEKHTETDRPSFFLPDLLCCFHWFDPVCHGTADADTHFVAVLDSLKERKFGIHFARTPLCSTPLRTRDNIEPAPSTLSRLDFATPRGTPFVNLVFCATNTRTEPGLAIEP